MNLALAVVLRRGRIPESRHRVHAAVCDAAGRVSAATPGAGGTTTFRSAAKPFQLVPLVERGHADRWGFSDADLALMAASHSGAPEHVARARSLLERIGLGPAHLACGEHEPFDEAAAARLREHPAERSPLYNNCSGKHAGMLALALAEGWPVEGYERADHPVQRLMRDTVAECCGLASGDLEVAVDGCSASVFGLPLDAMARGYARLAAARAGAGPRERALARIRDAMRGHPALTAGAGRFSTDLMEASGRRLVSKVGAEGLECVADPGRGLGIAVKVEDGAGRASAPAVVALLERLGVLGPDEVARLAPHARPVVRNHRGLEVGVLEAEVREVPAGAGARA